MADYIRFDAQGIITEKFKSINGSAIKDDPDVLKVEREVFDSITKFHKVVEGQVVEMSQAEKDALLQAEAQAIIDAENARIEELDDKIDIDLSGVTLTKIDTKIDNIGDLADAKVFLKKLCRYIIKFTA